MRNFFITIFILAALLMSSCSAGPGDNEQQNNRDSHPPTVHVKHAKHDSTYVTSGFYFLEESGQGVKMRKDHSDEDYNISEKPFVSVKNILSASAQKNVVEGREMYDVNIVLDNAGTKDFALGTGNPEHPYIAVVIANRLLYVVENTTQITTGKMQIMLVDYSEKEVNDMIDAIHHKR